MQTNATRTCPRCRFENSERADRCVLCQTPLVVLASDTSRRPPPPPPRRRAPPPPVARRDPRNPPPPPPSRPGRASPARDRGIDGRAGSVSAASERGASSARPRPPDAYGSAASDRLQRAPTSDRLQRSPTSDRLQRAPTSDRLQRAPTSDRLQRAPASDRQPLARTSDRVQRGSVSDRQPRAPTSDRMQRGSVSDRQPRAPTSDRMQRGSVSDRQPRAPTSDRLQRGSVSDRQPRAPTSDRLQRESTSDRLHRAAESGHLRRAAADRQGRPPASERAPASDRLERAPTSERSSRAAAAGQEQGGSTSDRLQPSSASDRPERAPETNRSAWSVEHHDDLPTVTVGRDPREPETRRAPHFPPKALASPLARPADDDTDTHGLDEGEPDTKDVDEVEVAEPDTRPHYENLEPDTMAHDEDTSLTSAIGALMRRAPPSHLEEPPPTMVVESRARRETPGPHEVLAAAPAAAQRQGSVLSDLPTMTYSPEVMEEAAREAAAAERARLATEAARRPARARKPWRARLLGAALLLTLTGGLALDDWLHRRAALARSAERLESAVAQLLTASAIPLAREAALVDRFEQEWGELRDSLGADAPALQRVRAKLVLVRGLLAVQERDLDRARQLASDPALELGGDTACRLALEGGIAAFSTGAAVGPLQAAIDRGFVRPELRAWRVRALLRDLDEERPADAEVLLGRLRELEALEPLDPALALRRVRARVTLQRWDEARAGLSTAPTAPLELRRRVARGELEAVVREPPAARALAWIEAHGLSPEVQRGGLRELGRHVLSRARALLLPLRQERAPQGAEQAELLHQLQLAHRLGWSPLPEEELELLALVLPGTRAGAPLQGSCLVALGTLGTPQTRRAALTALAVRLARTSSSDDRLRVRLLQATIATSGPDGKSDPGRLLAPEGQRARRELLVAELEALLELDRAREALEEAERALQEGPDPELEALRDRARQASAEKPRQPEPSEPPPKHPPKPSSPAPEHPESQSPPRSRQRKPRPQ
ncbi:MAG: hypothetical protein AB7N76_14440 [Planctomycetota bacterium]